MTKLELENIISQKGNLKNLPNTVLVDFLDKLSLDFEETKEKLIKLTFHLDNIEELYNITLKEYQERIK
jgi:hypothetical protein